MLRRLYSAYDSFHHRSGNVKVECGSTFLAFIKTKVLLSFDLESKDDFMNALISIRLVLSETSNSREQEALLLIFSHLKSNNQDKLKVSRITFGLTFEDSAQKLRCTWEILAILSDSVKTVSKQ